jgi:hypothetical protein
MECLRKLTKTEKEIKAYRLHDGGTMLDVEMPPGFFDRRPPIATATARRRTPFHPWKVDNSSIVMIQSQPQAS